MHYKTITHRWWTSQKGFGIKKIIICKLLFLTWNLFSLVTHKVGNPWLYCNNNLHKTGFRMFSLNRSPIDNYNYRAVCYCYCMTMASVIVVFNIRQGGQHMSDGRDTLQRAEATQSIVHPGMVTLTYEQSNIPMPWCCVKPSIWFH